MAHSAHVAQRSSSKRAQGNASSGGGRLWLLLLLATLSVLPLALQGAEKDASTSTKSDPISLCLAILGLALLVVILLRVCGAKAVRKSADHLVDAIIAMVMGLFTYALSGLFQILAGGNHPPELSTLFASGVGGVAVMMTVFVIQKIVRHIERPKGPSMAETALKALEAVLAFLLALADKVIKFVAVQKSGRIDSNGPTDLTSSPKTGNGIYIDNDAKGDVLESEREQLAKLSRERCEQKLRESLKDVLNNEGLVERGATESVFVLMKDGDYVRGNDGKIVHNGSEEALKKLIEDDPDADLYLITDVTKRIVYYRGRVGRSIPSRIGNYRLN